MKKVLFLLLFLLVLGAAGVNAQVRIGGDLPPNEAAVLDLNADNATDGTKGLALPRVSLPSTDYKLGYSGLLKGMLVYNTNAGIAGGNGVGVYYWDGSQWVKNEATIADGAVTTAKLADDAVTSAKIADGTIATEDIQNNAVTVYKLPPGATPTTFLRGDGSWVTLTANDADSIVGNEVTNATAGGGLVRAGGGSATNPYTLGIADNGVTTSKINNLAVTTGKIAEAAVTESKLAKRLRRFSLQLDSTVVAPNTPVNINILEQSTAAGCGPDFILTGWVLGGRLSSRWNAHIVQGNMITVWHTDASANPCPVFVFWCYN